MTWGIRYCPCHGRLSPQIVFGALRSSRSMMPSTYKFLVKCDRLISNYICLSATGKAGRYYCVCIPMTTNWYNSVLVLCIQDWVQTFPTELGAIWQRNLTSTASIFLLNKYLVFLWAVAQFILLFTGLSLGIRYILDSFTRISRGLQLRNNHSVVGLWVVLHRLPYYYATLLLAVCII